MSDLPKLSVYVHLTATSKPEEIHETVKVQLKGGSESNEESKETPDTIGTLTQKVIDHLQKVRNDGNKNYEIESISAEFGGESLPADAMASSLLEDSQDVFARVKITVDQNKTVAPLTTTAVGGAAGGGSNSKHELLKYRTITKYSYFESGDKWVKVLLSDLAGLADHPKEKIKIEFPT